MANYAALGVDLSKTTSSKLSSFARPSSEEQAAQKAALESFLVAAREVLN